MKPLTLTQGAVGIVDFALTQPAQVPIPRFMLWLLAGTLAAAGAALVSKRRPVFDA